MVWEHLWQGCCGWNKATRGNSKQARAWRAGYASALRAIRARLPVPRNRTNDDLALEQALGMALARLRERDDNHKGAE